MKNIYDERMDPEVIELCDALNSLPGIYTRESCSGHGKDPFSILFFVKDDNDARLPGLFFLTRCLDRRYWKYGNEWSLCLSVSDTYEKGILPTIFHLQSKAIGEEAFLQAKDLIANMEHHLNHEVFLQAYDLDIEMFNNLTISEENDAFYIFPK